MNKTVEEQISGFIYDAQASLKAAYCKGYATAKKEITAEAQESEYKRGLNDAEKAMKRVVDEPSNGGLYASEMQEIFETTNIVTIFLNHSISEIIERIREYEEKKTERNASPDSELHIGDEVYALDESKRKTVTAIDGNIAIVLSASGKYGTFNISELHKTGRRFAIDEILRELKG